MGVRAGDGGVGLGGRARFLTRARAEHGVAVSARALDLTRLVVSEMV
ncbi:ATP-binding protein, partial [Streptomyces griseofuscus]